MEKINFENTEETPVIEDAEKMPAPELSKEILKFKGDFEEMGENLEAALHVFRQRSDERLTDFMDGNDVDKLARIVAAWKETDMMTDTDLAKTNELLGEALQCIESIEMIAPARGVNEDVESLKNLAWAIKGIADKAADVEFAAREMDTEAAHKTAQISNNLSEAALSKANYLAQKIDALENY